MSDRDSVINDLNVAKLILCNSQMLTPEMCIRIGQAITSALALLKEQQQQIWEFQDQVEYLTDKQKEQKFLVDSDGKITPLPVVVRCKDCKWNSGTAEKPFCMMRSVPSPADWFCADGERVETVYDYTVQIKDE